MGQTLDIPTYGVCSLDGLGAATTGRTLVATDARRKEIYWARYVDGVRHDGPGVGRPDDIARRASAAGVDQAAGDGAVRYAAQLGLPVLERPRYPDPAVLVWLAADFVRSAAPTQPLNPIYLRRPDAVEPGRPKPVRQ
jgi:tRNA A37 threonylcarbamoyladenosine modification protein TsaB